MTQTNDALKPCPFCGSPAAYSVESDEGQRNDYDTIGCNVCPAEMQRLLHWMDKGGEHVSDLSALWNTRADLATKPDPLADPRVVALYEALYEVRDMLWSRPDISDRLRPLMGFAEEATNQKAAAALAAFDTGGKDE